MRQGLCLHDIGKRGNKIEYAIIDRTADERITSNIMNDALKENTISKNCVKIFSIRIKILT